MGKGPLSRFRVIDLTRVRSGPTCVRQLADWGAEVIQVEAPEGMEGADGGFGGARHGADFQNLHRNKRSLSRLHTAARNKGADSAAILHELGYDEVRVAALRQSRVI
jgi:crotonobetainyl-CoA:carnitine CoA-transferase CaiB-like acyl-CoA transferase